MSGIQDFCRNAVTKVCGKVQGHLLKGSGDLNIAWNRRGWGDKKAWIEKEKYGYGWGGKEMQSYTDIVVMSEKYFLSHVGNRRDLDVLEIAPGGGRFTTELLRVAKTLTLVDLNEACIEICTERFKYYEHMQYHVNDGKSLPMIADDSMDLAATYDAFVHVDPDIIREYVLEFARVLRPGGLAWIDHSGKGENRSSNRSAMTAELMQDFARESGFTIISQEYRNPQDCISVMRLEK